MILCTREYHCINPPWCKTASKCLIREDGRRPCDAKYTQAELDAAVAAEREWCLDVRLSDDDALRFACRVLESDAPAADKEAARDGLMAIRTRIRA